jgi:hypothetical protein
MTHNQQQWPSHYIHSIEVYIYIYTPFAMFTENSKTKKLFEGLNVRQDRFSNSN